MRITGNVPSCFSFFLSDFSEKKFVLVVLFALFGFKKLYLQYNSIILSRRRYEIYVCIDAHAAFYQL